MNMRTELNFSELKEEKVRLLEENNDIILATSLSNRVTARAVRYATEGLTIIFGTLTNLKKVAQIRESQSCTLLEKCKHRRDSRDIQPTGRGRQKACRNNQKKAYRLS